MFNDIIEILSAHTTYGLPGGFHLEGSLLFVMVTLATVVSIVFASLAWVYNDAQRRDKNPIIAILFILLTGWPGSFIWWFWLRPPVKTENAIPVREFAAQAGS